MIDYSTPRFKTSLVAKAAGVSHGAMRSYFSRGHWRVIGAAAKGEGLPNLFSLRDAMTFAVAARLIDATNASPEEAFNLAVLEFAHSGNEERGPGELFNLYDRGETLLVYWPDRRAARLAASDDIGGVYDLTDNGTPRQEAATIIALNPIEARVFAALGVSGHSWDGTRAADTEAGEFFAE